MKKGIRRLLFFSVVFFLCNSLSAQQVNMSVVSMPDFPDSAAYNQTFTFSVILYNDSSSSYSGPVYIVYYTDNTNVQYPDTFGTSNQVTIGPNTHDTINITGTNFSDTSVFKLGGNVVVVWPKSDGGTQIMVIDTFYTNLYITGYAGISDIELSEMNDNIYPVPASDMLFLPQNIAESSIEHVRITDMLGRTKVLLKQYSKSISVAELDNGFYFLEVKEKNNQIRIFKFIVSR